MLWTEKYSPKNFEEVLGNVKIKDAIMEWTEEWLKGNPQKCILLIGPPGTGKTTLAHLQQRNSQSTLNSMPVTRDHTTS